MGGLRFVNGLEEDRRVEAVEVAPEDRIEGTVAEAVLHGRIDRLEKRSGGTTVIDYKTGEIPSEKKVLEGRALQLLAYVMLLGGAEAIEYWALPKLGAEGEVLPIALSDVPMVEIEEK